MANTSATVHSLRISADELMHRGEAGTAATILDTRNPKAWSESNEKIRGAIRADLHNFGPEPSWAKDQLIVAYCT